MFKEIDLDSWSRKAHFEFFKQFSDPFFSLTANVKCTSLVARVKDQKVSLFIAYMHKSIIAANQIEEFRYRIVDGKVVCYDQVSASPTIPRPDNTFGFSYFPYAEDFATFAKSAETEIERVRQRTDLEPATTDDGTIHYTTIPWVSFTQITHPSHNGFKNSIPKIAFGKIFKQGEDSFIPVSVSGHHALLDGYHLGKFFELLEELFEQEI